MKCGRFYALLCTPWIISNIFNHRKSTFLWSFKPLSGPLDESTTIGQIGLRYQPPTTNRKKCLSFPWPRRAACHCRRASAFLFRICHIHTHIEHEDWGRNPDCSQLLMPQTIDNPFSTSLCASTVVNSPSPEPEKCFVTEKNRKHAKSFKHRTKLF